MWRKLAREHLLPHLPDSQLAGPILVFGQVEWILHALTVDSSAFSGARVAIWATSQPLYIPGEGMRGDFGERLRHPKSNTEWWDMESGKEELQLREMLRPINEKALPFYEHTATPKDLALYSESRYRGSVNPPIIEVEAYSWALAGDASKSMEALERLKRAVDAMPSYQTWGQPILERSLLVRKALTDDPSAVTHLLRGWRGETIRHLKLEKVASTL